MFWAPSWSPIEPDCGPARKKFSRRRRTFIRVYHHRLQSNDFGVSAPRSPGLFGAIFRHVRNMQSCSKSPWISTVDSIGQRGGSGPRRASLWRVNRGALDARHTCFGLLPGAQSSPTAGPLERIFAPKAHFHPGVSPPTTVQRFWSVHATLTGAVRSDIQTLYRHTKLL